MTSMSAYLRDLRRLVASENLVVRDLTVAKHVKITVEHPRTHKTRLIVTSSSPGDRNVMHQLRSFLRKTARDLAAVAALAAAAFSIMNPTPASAATSWFDPSRVQVFDLMAEVVPGAQGGKVIVYPIFVTGQIAQGDDQNFLAALRKAIDAHRNGPTPSHPARIFVVLNSPGGHVVTALAMAQMLRLVSVNPIYTTETRVDRECLSACSIIHLASNSPVGPLPADGRLCVHMASLPERENGTGKQVPSIEATQEMLRQMQAIGIAADYKKVYSNMISAGGEMLCLTPTSTPVIGFRNVLWPFKDVDYTCDANGECND